MVLIITRDWLCDVDIASHQGKELDTHSLVLEVPDGKLVLVELVLLQVLEEAVMLLRTNLPLCPTRSEGVVLGLLDGGVVEDVGALSSEREPAVKAIAAGVPVEGLEVLGTIPGRQRGGLPTDLGSVGVVQNVLAVGVDLGEERLDSAEIPVHPADEGLVDDVGRDGVVFGVGESRLDQRWNDAVLHEDDIIVHLDVQDVVLDSFVRVTKAVGKVVLSLEIDIPRLVSGFAVHHGLEEFEISLVGRSLDKDDSVQRSTVLDQVSLNYS